MKTQWNGAKRFKKFRRKSPTYTGPFIYEPSCIFKANDHLWRTNDKSNKSTLILGKLDKQISNSLNLTLQFKQPHMANGYYVRTVLDKDISKILEKSISKNIFLLNNPLNCIHNWWPTPTYKAFLNFMNVLPDFI